MMKPILCGRRPAVLAVGLALCAFVAGVPFQAKADTTQYTYDALGRVSTVTYGNGVVVTYSYDAAGNRTQKIANVAAATLVWMASATPCANNCWGTKNW